jgi:hypothetical protein
MIANLRRYMKVTAAAVKVFNGFQDIWAGVRSYTIFLNTTYKRVAMIAVRKDINIPPQKINMNLE